MNGLPRGDLSFSLIRKDISITSNEPPITFMCVLSESMCLCLSIFVLKWFQYFCDLRATSSTLSLSRVHFIGGRAAKKQANEVSRFTALPPIRKPMNGPLPKQASGTFMLGAVPIKLVTQHQPRNKNDRWSSRLFSQLLSLSLSLSLSLTSLSYLSKARERH